MLLPARHSSKSSTLPYQDMASRLPHFGSQAGKRSRFRLFGTLDGLWRSRQPKTFAWGANREPYSIMEYLPATGIADWPSCSGGGPSRCSDRRLAPIRLFARRPDRVRGRRRSGTTAGPSAPAGNTASPRTGSSASSTIARPSRPRATSSLAQRLRPSTPSMPSPAISSRLWFA
jgi:hypothetical protein